LFFTKLTGMFFKREISTSSSFITSTVSIYLIVYALNNPL
jgi:hypothetical protein